MEVLHLRGRVGEDRAETTDLAKSRPADAERLAALWESQWARFQADAKRGK